MRRSGIRCAALGILACWVALVLLFLGTFAWSQHGSWHDKYRGANAMPCCGPRDCRATHARLLTQTATEVTVEVEAMLVTLPAAALHQSEDTQDWVCQSSYETPMTSTTIRCVFIAVGG